MHTQNVAAQRGESVVCGGSENNHYKERLVASGAPLLSNDTRDNLPEVLYVP